MASSGVLGKARKIRFVWAGPAGLGLLGMDDAAGQAWFGTPSQGWFGLGTAGVLPLGMDDLSLVSTARLGRHVCAW